MEVAKLLSRYFQIDVFRIEPDVVVDVKPVLSGLPCLEGGLLVSLLKPKSCVNVLPCVLEVLDALVYCV